MEEFVVAGKGAIPLVGMSILELMDSVLESKEFDFSDGPELVSGGDQLGELSDEEKALFTVAKTGMDFARSAKGFPFLDSDESKLIFHLEELSMNLAQLNWMEVCVRIGTKAFDYKTSRLAPDGKIIFSDKSPLHFPDNFQFPDFLKKGFWDEVRESLAVEDFEDRGKVYEGDTADIIGEMIPLEKAVYTVCNRRGDLINAALDRCQLGDQKFVGLLQEIKREMDAILDNLIGARLCEKMDYPLVKIFSGFQIVHSLEEEDLIKLFGSMGLEVRIVSSGNEQADLLDLLGISEPPTIH